ncbi:hypothetical protein NARC_250008 [Candidatus Nitrosocosmicus arcticus]|uniref:Uncharacterized protein n=2 Tax=Candidatus Nitrosocosmicus arcticus TaxID=2035267 RepID=A0A557SQV9_9ARCH|nr:hypothetical protein NARC_250008 [Candidatus Nitrosocosmicus arcticus]
MFWHKMLPHEMEHPQQPYQLSPLPDVVVISPIDRTFNSTTGDNSSSTNNNITFVYSSPDIQLVNIPEGIDSSCYGLTVHELVNKSTDLCYGIQVNELLKHPTNQTQREQLLNQSLPDEFFDKNMTGHFDKKYLLQYLKKSHYQQLQELFGHVNYSLINENNNQMSTECSNSSSLYNDFINPGPTRFFMIHPCITVTRNVTLVHNPAAGLDGDTVFALQLDKPYSNLVTTANFNSKMTGGIWVELMCQSLNNATALVHKGDCSAGTSPQFPLPAVGDRVNVTGAYVIDIREGGHAEIHPAFAMSILS